MQGLVGRLQDFEDEVRVAAIEGITAAAKHSLALLDGGLAPLTEARSEIAASMQTCSINADVCECICIVSEAVSLHKQQPILRQAVKKFAAAQVATRLRDRKQAVRHTAATQLLAVFWASCSRRSDEASVSSGAHVSSV